jgi:aspartyl-tRNA(Asn)/glutamyl-tRNA(Gln) amidotransferase subunit A
MNEVRQGLGNEICDLSVFDLARAYRRNELSPVEVVSAHLERCKRLNPPLNAYLTVLHDSAIQTARAIEALFRTGIDLGPLQGVPVSIKDLIRMRGLRTTAGSRVLLQEPPDQKDAIIVQRLRAAGAIIIGKTNLHEFAVGDPDPEGPFGLVQNPRQIGFHPGSSSSGAGAAVAAGMGVIAIGTDTGGSIRIPAYLCGVAGLKPTTGRIPLDGIIPLSISLDAVGPLARRVSDVAAAFSVCSCLFPGPGGTPGGPVDFFGGQLNQSVRDWRVGVPRDGFFGKVQPEVRQAFEKTLQLLRDMGCRLIDFDPPGIEGMPDLVFTIIQAEGAAYHECFRGREELYGANFRENIFPGRDIRATTYLAARERQLELQHKWQELVYQLEVIVVPSGPAVAPKHGTKTIEVEGQSFPFRPLLGRFTRPFNLLGWPALSVPNGTNSQGLPTGVQLVGPPDSERRLFILGHRLEKDLGLVAELGIEPRVLP